MQLSDADGDALPDWLHYDPKSSLLEGVPGVKDAKSSVTLKLVVADSNGHQKVTDQFNMEVVEDNQAPSSGGSDNLQSADDQLPRPVTCLPTSAVTTATVVIDADAETDKGGDRAATVRRFARHLDLPVAAVRYLPAGKAPLDDSSALVAGVGDAAGRGSQTGGVVLQWEVGCGNVFAAHMDRLQRVETTAADGSMSAAVGRGVVGWHVANKKPTTAGSKRHRHRRAAHRLNPTATPVVAVTPPTVRPVPTHTVKEPDPTRVPPSRVVFTTPSTIFSTTVSERRRTRRKRTRRPKPGRSTTPVVSQLLTSTTTRSYTLEPPYIEPSVTKVPTTTSLITATPPLPPPRISDLHWSGRPLRVDLHSNEILDLKVPDDLFEGGAPGRLHLRLLTADGLVVSQWLRLDEASSRLVGMPLDTHIGRQMYTLEATDGSGRVARATVVVDVRRKIAASYNAAFESAARLGLDYDRFTEDIGLRLDVVEKIAGGFGDPDPSQLAVTRISHGSVVIAWTNSSIPGDRVCPLSTLVDIRSRMLSPDGSVNPSFREALRPYQILSATMRPHGSCASESLVQFRITSTRGPEPVVPQKVTDSGFVVDVIVPVVIVVCCVIVAIVIACVLIRKRRHAEKTSSPDKTVKPGAPIIFASELDDNGTAPPSKPLIGANGERAPAPPNYLAATAGTAPVHDHRRPLLSDPIADQMSPLRFQAPPGSSVKHSGVHSSSRR